MLNPAVGTVDRPSGPRATPSARALAAEFLIVSLAPSPAHQLSNMMRHDKDAEDGDDPPVEQRPDQVASREGDGQHRSEHEQVPPAKRFQGRAAVGAVQGSFVWQADAGVPLKRRSGRQLRSALRTGHGGRVESLTLEEANPSRTEKPGSATVPFVHSSFLA